MMEASEIRKMSRRKRIGAEAFQDEIRKLHIRLRRRDGRMGRGLAWGTVS